LYSIVRLEDERITITYSFSGQTEFKVGASYVVTISEQAELSGNRVYVQHDASCAASRFPATDPGVCTCLSQAEAQTIADDFGVPVNFLEGR
jgi:hypothetical protein